MGDFFDDFDSEFKDDDFEDDYGEDHEESDIEESVNDDPALEGDANEERHKDLILQYNDKTNH